MTTIRSLLRDRVTLQVRSVDRVCESKDLRRLRRNGFLTHIERSNRYRVTDDGRRLALVFAKTYARIVRPSLAELDPALPEQIAHRSRLARGWRSFERALDARIADAAVTA